MPDVFVPVDSSVFTRSVTQLYLDGRFNNFVYQYYIKHLPEFNLYKSTAQFAAGYQNTDAAWKQLVDYAAQADSINLQKIPPKERDNIQNWIKAYLARFKWRTQGFYQVLNRNDKIVNSAIETLQK
jgi:carboxyl-terminal processing protease